MPSLKLPHVRYKTSYLHAFLEFQKEGWWEHLDYELVANNFELYLQALEDRARGIALPKDWVPGTEYWLIDNEEYIGSVHIRHRLTEK